MANYNEQCEGCETVVFKELTDSLDLVYPGARLQKDQIGYYVATETARIRVMDPETLQETLKTNAVIGEQALIYAVQRANVQAYSTHILKAIFGGIQK